MKELDVLNKKENIWNLDETSMDHNPTTDKHRIILLYGITRHCAGEDVITQTSKTSLLQTHHAAK